MAHTGMPIKELGEKLKAPMWARPWRGKRKEEKRESSLHRMKS